MPAFGADVVAVIEKLGLRDVVLIGHSMGGDVIVEAARALPERIIGLVWVDTYNTLGNSRAAERPRNSCSRSVRTSRRRSKRS